MSTIFGGADDDAEVEVYSRNPNYVEPEVDYGSLFAGFEMPEMPDYSAIFAEQAEASEKAARMAEMDNYWATKYDAANQAVSEVNTQITNEAAQASLYGLDYNIDETDRATRVNNKFAELWSEDNEASLQGLIKQYGTTKTWTSGIVRGTPEAKTDPTTSKEAGGKARARGMQDQDEEDKLSKKDLLGG